MSRVRTALLGAVVILLAVMAWRFAQGDRLASSGISLPQSAAYVGTSACAACHQVEHRAWLGSHHDLAMQPATDESVRGDFNDARFSDGTVTSTFFRRDGKFFVNTDGPDGDLQDFEVKYTFGVDPLQQYLVELSDGRVQALSIAWDTRARAAGGQSWFHLYPGTRIGPGDDLHWTGRLQNWNFMCADCHSTGVRKGYDASARRFTTTYSEIDVGCEACHGPGSRHLEWAGTSALARRVSWADNGLQAQLTERQGVSWIADAGQPRRSAPRTTNREIEVCAQCHSRRAQIADGYTAGAPFSDFYVPDPVMPGLYHADGQQRDEVYVHGSFVQSRMHAAGVTCSDCHEPHSQQLRESGNQLCVRCHSPETYDAPAHSLHPAGSPASECVSCHMPGTTYMVIDPRRDHSFRVPRPDQSVALGVPNACNGCHADRTPQWAADVLRGRLGRDPAGFQRFGEAFHAAEQGAAGAAARLAQMAVDPSQPSIVRASALARLNAAPDAIAVAAARAGARDVAPEVRWSALALLDRLPPPERVVVAAPLLDDPLRSVRIQAAWVLAPAAALLAGTASSAAFARAAAEFRRAQELHADRAENRLALGTFDAQLGRVADAEREYRAALELVPRYAPAYVNLADLLRQQGREADAERTLREGLAEVPGDAALHHALGLSLTRSGNRAAAIAEFERAMTAAPERAEYAYVHAVALNSDGRGEEAIRALERARLSHPRDRDLLFALATFNRDRGARAEATRYARLLAELEDPRGAALLESLR